MWKRGLGRVFQRGGRWWVLVRGVEHRESSGSPRKGDAIRLLKTRITEVQEGKFRGSESRQPKVSELLDAVLRDYSNGKSLSWAKFVDGHLRPFFGSMKASRVGSTEIASYIEHRRAQGVKNATINRELTILRRGFSLAIQQDPPESPASPAPLS